MWTENELTGIGYQDPVFWKETGVSWKRAVEEAKKEHFGYSSWRLPNVLELITLAGKIPCKVRLQWSSTPNYFETNYQWLVDFGPDPGISATSPKESRSTM